MKNKITTELVSNLFGNTADYTFENRIFNVVMLLISLTGGITLLYDSILTSRIIQFLDFLCFIYPMGCYFYSKKTKRYNLLIIPSFFFFFLELSIAWIFNNGIHGSLPFFFFLLTLYCVILIEKPFRFFIPFVLTTILIMIIIEYSYPDYLVYYNSRINDFIDTGVSLILCIMINCLGVYLVFNEYIKERLSNKKLLEQAIADKEIIERSFNEIQTLRGILPICSNCKKIRDSCGSWKIIEEYFCEHSPEAQFSHGICPDCFQNLYPDIARNFQKN